MEKLTTDIRFTLFNVCYKRILVIWITLAFVVLLSLLFSGFVVSRRENSKIVVCVILGLYFYILYEIIYANYFCRGLNYLGAESHG